MCATSRSNLDLAHRLGHDLLDSIFEQVDVDLVLTVRLNGVAVLFVLPRPLGENEANELALDHIHGPHHRLDVILAGLLRR